MASSGKRKTTMAKLNREAKLREKKAAKSARKDERKRAAQDGDVVSETLTIDSRFEAFR